MDTKASKTIRHWLATIAVMVVLVNISGCGKFSPQKQLEEWVAKQKEQSRLPKKMGPNRVLIDIQAGDLELIQVFRVNGISQDEIEEKKESIYEQTIQEVKKKKEEIKNLITYRVVMTFKFQNAQGDLLYEFSIKPWEDL